MASDEELTTQASMASFSPTVHVEAPEQLGPPPAPRTNYSPVLRPVSSGMFSALFPQPAFRLPPRPILEGTGAYVYGLPPPPSPAKRQRVASTPEESLTLPGNSTLRLAQFGPFLEKYGLFDESGVRRHVSSNASGSSSSNVEIPPWVLDAHRKANYQQIVASVMGNNARSQYNSLPLLVQDVIVHMALVSTSCWQHLDAVVSDVYNTWWRVWAQASLEVRNPVSLGEHKCDRVHDEVEFWSTVDRVGEGDFEAECYGEKRAVPGGAGMGVP